MSVVIVASSPPSKLDRERAENARLRELLVLSNDVCFALGAYIDLKRYSNPSYDDPAVAALAAAYQRWLDAQKRMATMPLGEGDEG